MPRKSAKELRSEGHASAAAGPVTIASVPQAELSGEGPLPLADEGQAGNASTGQPEQHGDGRAHDAEGGQRFIAAALLPNGDDEATDPLPVGHHNCAPSSSPQSEEGHAIGADSRGECADLASTIAQIRYHHRTRTYAMEQRKRADLSLGSFLRVALGWSKALPDAERKRIADQAAALIKIGETVAKGKPAGIDEPAYAEWRHIIAASISARAPFDEVEKVASKEMTRLAKSLPVWTWAEGVKGLGPVSLAVIVGEAGDLAQYPKKGHLWKRMGLAVMGSGDGTNDVRQGGLRKGASADEWVVHGYSPARRSRMFVIGDVMVKVGERYRDIYLKRKEYERAKLPDAKPIVLHRRAQRYMEKLLLRDLWQEWKRAGMFKP